MRITGLFDCNGNSINFEVDGDKQELNLDGCLCFPAGIDPHVHFRCPGGEYKEDWYTGSRAALEGGYTFVCDMPNTNPCCVTIHDLKNKVAMVDDYLKSVPLKYRLYFGAAHNSLDELENLGSYKDKIAGIKIFMGSSTGPLLVDDQDSLEYIFKVASSLDILVAVHAEDEQMIRERKELPFSQKSSPKYHSFLRNDDVAAKAIGRALDLAKKYGTRLYILHVSTRTELDLIEDAKRDGIKVYAEVTPHHLFLSDEEYSSLGTKALVNPPLRKKEEQEALFEAIDSGVIDSLGSDHAPHLLSEKNKPYGEAPCGMPGIEWSFALLFQAHLDKKISLKNLIRITSTGPREILKLPRTNDYVILDPNLERSVSKHTVSKANWSPYTGKILRGWPIATIIDSKLYATSKMNEREVSYV